MDGTEKLISCSLLHYDPNVGDLVKIGGNVEQFPGDLAIEKIVQNGEYAFYEKMDEENSFYMGSIEEVHPSANENYFKDNA